MTKKYNGNPQIEDGFLRIASELALIFQSTHLSGNEWMVLWVVINKTYGWNKKSDAISLTQFQKETGLSRPAVSDAINSLVGKSLLVVVGKSLLVLEYAINKKYKNWVVGKSLLVGKSVCTSREIPTETSREIPTHNRQYKDTIQNTIPPTPRGGGVDKKVEVSFSPESKEDWDFWQANMCEITRNQTFHKNALVRMRRNFGKEKLWEMIQYAAAAHIEKYASGSIKCNSPTDLEKKWDALALWAKAKKTVILKRSNIPGRSY